jgi:hypothetical protein
MYTVWNDNEYNSDTSSAFSFLYRNYAFLVEKVLSHTHNYRSSASNAHQIAPENTPRNEWNNNIFSTFSLCVIASFSNDRMQLCYAINIDKGVGLIDIYNMQRSMYSYTRYYWLVCFLQCVSLYVLKHELIRVRNTLYLLTKS